ncbi:hypothetical protein J2T32_002318 [Kerstersia gyiorum]|nr:hypothetical protein [Kerstersia gyiorum]MCP1718667.1 hypothetical protein [Kerstersia gyiorum]MCW2187781.1 hypothetical protein [Kerstersia gyiorum]
MRGEHGLLAHWGQYGDGSSPHARGTPDDCIADGYCERFIPACAGNTEPSSFRICAATVHPRMRGEHDAGRDDPIGAVRFIPACAGNTYESQSAARQKPVHPRMRGEHAALPHQIFLIFGSSPHARGTPCAAPWAGPPTRFIPACAGNTPAHCAGCARPPVHPRMRGEHFSYPSRIECGHGSSPHARGTLYHEAAALAGERFIPACAGNTKKLSSRRERRAVHPRMRGEHAFGSLAALEQVGSSPHARGTRSRMPPRLAPPRFIPACAGNTSCMPASASASPVHPRMRGEHQRMSPGQGRVAGSSPHARGTQAMIISFRHKGRFIPACAGNTAPPRGRCTREPVHPRMRGEHTCNACRLCCPRGSSPHARGTRFAHAANGSPCRFIPACAGNTFIFEKLFVRHTVHPRMRGEHAGPCWTASGRCGSSPHARGTPSRWIASAASARFIPACAGNTRCCPRVEPPTPVHPRMRGEHGSRLAQRPRSGGSSPHARGTLSWRKTLALSITVHPRMRGEHAALPHQIFLIFGSSPHARGTRG